VIATVRARTAVNRLRAWHVRRRLVAPRLLRAFADVHPRASFVEIGANAGDHHDHLRPHILERQWRGLMVEPVPYVFDRLVRNYGHIGRVTLVNAAVGSQDGERPFFHLREAAPDERHRLPHWYDGIGSFSREAILSHRPQLPDIDSRLVETTVPTLSFESLCRDHGVERVDLLAIDTEGHDFEILRSIDLDRRRPAIVVYEHFHLAPADRAACAALLRSHGYRTMEEGFDTLCLHPSAADPLQRLWERLRPAVAGVAKYDEG
jgi:FkbM family methyltransferase